MPCAERRLAMTSQEMREDPLFMKNEFDVEGRW